MIELNKDNFDEEVLGSDKPVVIDFWGPNCEPCLALMPQVEELAEAYGDKIKFCKVSNVGNRRLCINLKVMALPTFMAYKNGEEVKRISDHDMTIDDVKAFIEEVIA